MKNTNAARLLDQHKIAYKLVEYKVDETDLSATTLHRYYSTPSKSICVESVPKYCLKFCSISFRN